MKIKNLFVVALAVVFALASCKKEQPVTPPAEDLAIKLNASLYGFTKATDTAFEANDAIGVSIYKNSESYIHNAKFTYNGSALTSNTEYTWYDEKDVEATITAYYPYAELDATATDYTFTVNADQSSSANYKASDFMVATTKSKPTENAVALPFKHALSKVVITINNETEETIAGVWLEGAKGEISFNTATGAVTTGGSAGTIKSYKSADNTWEVIIAPQTASPKLIITTAADKQYTFTLAEGVAFNSGKYSTANVTITPETIKTGFTPNIENWVADNELQFGQDVEEDNGDNDDPTQTPTDPEGGDNTDPEGGDNTDPEGGDNTDPEQGENDDPVVEPTPGTPDEDVRIYLSTAWGWTYLWCWDSNGTQIFEGASWPGTVKEGEEDGYYYWTVPEAYVGKTVNLLFAKKTETEEEQSPDYTNVTLSKSLYFYLTYTAETGVQLILEDK